MSVVGENIRIEREKQGYSQNSLAKRAGIAQATINAIERSTKSPSVDTVQLLADALNVSVSYLMGETKKAVTFTAQEKKLVEDFRSLNQQGREYVLQSMAMAVRIYLSGKPGAVSGVESRAE